MGKSLDDAIASINKQFSKGSIAKMSDAPMNVEVISTGVATLDAALGAGGFPRGRVIEILGQEAVGKSSLALHLVAEAQKQGGVCAYVDSENALDIRYAAAIGVNVDDLYVSQPDTGEQALEIVDRLIGTNELAVIVVDSVAALVPRAEIEGEMGDAVIGTHARLMSQALRKITTRLNQYREKIGVMFGDVRVPTGGKALKFYASVRLDLSRIETLKDGDEFTGTRIRAKVIKNKIAPPFRIAEYNIKFGQGIDTFGSLMEAAMDVGIIERSGAYYSFNGETLGQGREKTVAFLKENPDRAELIRGTLESHLASLGVEGYVPEDDEHEVDEEGS